MADQQQIIVRNPEDQEPIYDAEMGNGGPLVVQPGNGDRPNIYVNAPQFHWHQAPRGAADEQAGFLPLLPKQRHVKGVEEE